MSTEKKGLNLGGMQIVSSRPLVSVIMPYYEEPDYVLDAVRSVEAQTYSPVELILVDDCSCRAPAADLLEWRQMSNLRIIRHAENKGPAASRNTAIKAAQGDLILPLDAVDLISAHYMERAVPRLVADPEIGGVYTNVQDFGAGESVWIPKCALPSSDGPNTFLYRRAVFDSVGGYKEHLRFAEDFDFWISVLERGWRFAHLEEALFLRRLKPGARSDQEHWVDVMRGLLGEHEELCLAYAEDLVLSEIERYWDEAAAYRALYKQYHDLLALSPLCQASNTHEPDR